MTEKAFQSEVVKFAHLMGWLVYHTYDSRRSAPGFPDLVLVKGERILYRELKTETGKLTDAQTLWGKKLREAGGNWTVWRPSQLDEIYRFLMGVRS